jgi:1,4-dihydroxy-2-naphthoyl-CoA hydrolase
MDIAMDIAGLSQKSLPPFAKLLGLTIVEVTPERVVGELLVREELSNGVGALHGGVAMSIADTLGAVATMVNLKGQGGTTTMESKTNFVSPGVVGSKVRAETTPVHRGKRTHVWQTRITTPEGKLVALVTQTQMVL